MTAKLGDFGLARFAHKGSKLSPTTTLGYTTTVRGTLAYLPNEYVRKGQLGTAVDVYSFGVVSEALCQPMGTEKASLAASDTIRPTSVRVLLNDPRPDNTMGNQFSQACVGLKTKTRCVCMCSTDPTVEEPPLHNK